MPDFDSDRFLTDGLEPLVTEESEMIARQLYGVRQQIDYGLYLRALGLAASVTQSTGLTESRSRAILLRLLTTPWAALEQNELDLYLALTAEPTLRGTALLIHLERLHSYCVSGLYTKDRRLLNRLLSD